MADAKVDTLTSQKQEIQDEKNRIKSELEECNRSLQTKMDDIDNLREQVNKWVLSYTKNHCGVYGLLCVSELAV